MKPRKNSKRRKKTNSGFSSLALEKQVMVLALNKVTTDWYRNKFTFSEGPEKYFEDWMEVNNMEFSETFKTELFSLFVKFLIMRANTGGRVYGG